MGRRQSLRCSTSGKALITCSRARCTLGPFARSARWKPTQAPGSTRTAGFRRPCSARENPRERCLFDPQQLRRFLSFIVEQRLAGQGHTLKESVLAHRCTGREQTSTAGPIPSFGWTPGAFATSCGSTPTGRSDPVVISLPKGSYVVFEANTASLTHTAPPSPPPPSSGSSSGGAGATANAAGSELQAREDRRRRTGVALRLSSPRLPARTRQAGKRSTSCSPWLRTEVWRGRLRCPRTATSSLSPGRATPRLVRRISM